MMTFADRLAKTTYYSQREEAGYATYLNQVLAVAAKGKREFRFKRLPLSKTGLRNLNIFFRSKGFTTTLVRGAEGNRELGVRW